MGMSQWYFMFTPNTIWSNSKTSDKRLWLVPFLRSPWHSLSSGTPPIRWYASAMSYAAATGNHRKHSSLSETSHCGFGPWCTAPFSGTSSPIADASVTVLVSAESLSGLITGTCGRFPFDSDCICSSTFLIDPLLPYCLVVRLSPLAIFGKVVRPSSAHFCLHYAIS